MSDYVRVYLEDKKGGRLGVSDVTFGELIASEASGFTYDRGTSDQNTALMRIACNGNFITIVDNGLEALILPSGTIFVSWNGFENFPEPNPVHHIPGRGWFIDSRPVDDLHTAIAIVRANGIAAEDGTDLNPEP